jgi:hypothetical protein
MTPLTSPRLELGKWVVMKTVMRMVDRSMLIVLRIVAGKIHAQ